MQHVHFYHKTVSSHSQFTISGLYTKCITFTLHRLAGLLFHTVFIHHHTTELSLTTDASDSSYSSSAPPVPRLTELLV
jgi:succinate dehydrogenase/fumarate reductase cytochrome b subunit